ncbi:MAG: rod shape-determining protein RodA [Spirochaetales bacterium]|nr:rod shape-determining protein RodA [Spirochaetales bacterium]
MRRVSLFGFDFALLGAALALTIFGVLFVYSSGIGLGGELNSDEYMRQIIWAVSGLALMTGVILVSYNRLRSVALYLYGFINLLLLVTLLVGREVHGARSWLGIGGFGIQPSEFAKVFTVLFLASYFARIGKRLQKLPGFLGGFGIVLVPMGLILLQPDMGTALVFIPIFLFMAFAAGAPLRYVTYLLAAGALALVLALYPSYQRFILGSELGLLGMITTFGVARYFLAALALVAALAFWGYRSFKRGYFYWILYAVSLLLVALVGALGIGRVLKDYQIMRFVVFLDPRVDPRGAGWNLIQSVTAVGSGGLLGKGYLQGTQSHYQFLPQQSTDFIFSILAEEWGFVGGLAVFALFLVILIRGIRIMYTARDDFAMNVCAGLVGMVFFHVIVNVGMAMGIMPITGIPLFFLSYGGSSLWTGLIAVGLLLNIHLRRYSH